MFCLADCHKIIDLNTQPVWDVTSPGFGKGKLTKGSCLYEIVIPSGSAYLEFLDFHVGKRKISRMFGRYIFVFI